MGFFNLSFEDRVRQAIARRDPKLVQLMVGYKYCQLWQYAIGHVIISYNMLEIERAASCQLPLKIINTQLPILRNQLELLQQVSLNKKSNFEGLLSSRDLFQKLIDITYDKTNEYKNDIIAMNKFESSTCLFSAPDDGASRISSRREDSDDGASSSRREGSDDGASSRREVETIVDDKFGYISESLKSMESAMKLSLVEDCNSKIEKLKKCVMNKVWEEMDLKAAIAYTPAESNGPFADWTYGLFASLIAAIVNLTDQLNGNEDLSNPEVVKRKCSEIGRIIGTLQQIETQKSCRSHEILLMNMWLKENAIDKLIVLFLLWFIMCVRVFTN